LIIPAYNAEKNLRETLENVFRAIHFYHGKTGHNVEIIVVDSGSTDGTVKVARDYNIKVVSYTERKQMGAARNAGAKVAKGKYLTFLDAGGQISENIFCIVDYYLSSEQVIGGGTIMYPDNPNFFLNWGFAILMFLQRLMNISGGFVYCLRSLFEITGGYSETLWALEDLELVRRLRELGKTENKQVVRIEDGFVLTRFQVFGRIKRHNFLHFLFGFMLPTVFKFVFYPEDKLRKFLQNKEFWHKYYYDAHDLP
jgi:glycosyltransferase involved in cell wall biosynthesis